MIVVIGGMVVVIFVLIVFVGLFYVFCDCIGVGFL